jgi:hypothetical protein
VPSARLDFLADLFHLAALPQDLDARNFTDIQLPHLPSSYHNCHLDDFPHVVDKGRVVINRPLKLKKQNKGKI